ncbi:hypothetical protein FOBRF1_004470 [Fusarium oxysporum]
MEKVSQTPHPNIVGYYGCRVRRGRITSMVFERLDQTLQQYSSTPEFEKLDKPKFLEALQSAVAYIHSLDLAHNDVNPHNIMVKDGMPVLIDFGSCQPVGQRLQSLGTEGAYSVSPPSLLKSFSRSVLPRTPSLSLRAALISTTTMAIVLNLKVRVSNPSTPG